MAGKTTLMVPIRVDALFVETDGLEFGSPFADFSQLPYKLSNDNKQNGNTPNLAEYTVVQSGTLAFPKGLHLHWALPDALTTGYHRDESTVFPAVPNRWLVRRLDQAGTLQKSMIVESDFLHPRDSNGQPQPQKPTAGIASWPPITFPTRRQQPSGAAFRYMGRTLSLADWLTPAQGNEYLNQRDNNSQYKFSDYPLTAIGYGEPAFAAYYPNCHSVFGFCDVDTDLKEGNSYEYQVIGWFNETNLDPLQAPDFTQFKTDADRYNALQNEYKWILTDADKKNPFPALTIYYGSLTLTPGQVKRWPQPGNKDFRVAIGNTGGEALAALLANDLAPADKVIVEDQLEAMNVAASLQGVEVDYLAHFAQTRHQRGFRGLAAGRRWAVVLQQPKKKPVNAAEARQQEVEQSPLPDVVAHALDALNMAQEAYDTAHQEINELRYQTFCDWHKFLVAAYSTSSGMQPFTDQRFNMAQFISDQTLALLNSKISSAGKLTLTKTTAKAEGAVNATLSLANNTIAPAQIPNDTLAAQVLLRLKALIDTMVAARITDKYELVNQPAEHFWKPREPVVLISGPVAVSTARHGEDGNLACTIVNLPDAPGAKAFFPAVDKLKPAGANNPFIQTQTKFPWHPIILEWSASVTPLKPNAANNNAPDFASTFVTTNFSLQQNEPDFSPAANLKPQDQYSYEGRCIMTPTAGTQLDGSLRTFLIRATLDDCRDRAAAKEADYVNRLLTWYQAKLNVKPPAGDAEKLAWLKQQKPFVNPNQKDENGNPVLFALPDLVAWYDQKPVSGPNNTVAKLDSTHKAQDPIYSAIHALSKLGGMTVLSQALGGFNAALMTRKQVLQIPIENPFEADLTPKKLFQDLNITNRVAEAVGKHHPMAPLSNKVFCPIRSGKLVLGGLTLKDTFGQQWNAPLGGAPVVSSNGLTDPNQKAITYLPPRFSAPARLNFRWLAALSNMYGDEVEMNNAPVTTPICGWLIPNNFDNSLMVYDNTGKALGFLNLMAEWTPAPGRGERLKATDIPNPYLRRVVGSLAIDVGMMPADITIKQHFLASFLSTLDSAIEAIEPASFAQHEALALLMGRPIAVVRARVDLQLMGEPTKSETIADPTIPGGKATRLKPSPHWQAFVDQDWNAFANDWGKFYGCTYDQIMKPPYSCSFDPKSNPDYTRTTQSFEKVVVPMRLGEHQLLNDGLVGFWKEMAGGELGNVFHAPQTLADLKLSDDVAYKEGRVTPCIRAYDKNVTDNLSLTFHDDPLALTILMDPRGVIHATCGMLPVYKLEIPSVYYADTLKRMGVTFRVSPILTDTEELHAALPKEPGYTWSWITQPSVSNWQETGTIIEATEQAHFFKPPKIVEGWLKLTPANHPEKEQH